jgi:hypothetical protein
MRSSVFANVGGMSAIEPAEKPKATLVIHFLRLHRNHVKWDGGKVGPKHAGRRTFDQFTKFGYGLC